MPCGGRLAVNEMLTSKERVTVARLIEFVYAEWSAPSHRERKKLESAKLPESVEIVVLDHDTLEPDSALQGWGECRLDGGKWTTVDAVLEEIGENSEIA